VMKAFSAPSRAVSPQVAQNKTLNQLCAEVIRIAHLAC
jgi:hypothetical protein